MNLEALTPEHVYILAREGGLTEAVLLYLLVKIDPHMRPGSLGWLLRTALSQKLGEILNQDVQVEVRK